MSSTHVLSCPVCHSTLLIENRDAVGGMSMPNLVLLDSAVESPAAATARTAWENAQTAKEAAQAKLDTANAALESASQATPIDDAKVTAAAADALTAKTEFDAASKAEADAQVAYEAAANAPIPVPVPVLPTGSVPGVLSSIAEVGTTAAFTATFTSDPAIPTTGSPTPAVAQATADVAAAQTALNQANAAKTAAGALTPPDPAAVTAAQAGVNTATANKATADKALADAKAAA